MLQAGDEIQVVAIDYQVSKAGLEGIIAVEGYLHKLDDSHGPFQRCHDI